MYLRYKLNMSPTMCVIAVANDIGEVTNCEPQIIMHNKLHASNIEHICMRLNI